MDGNHYLLSTKLKLIQFNEFLEPSTFALHSTVSAKDLFHQAVRRALEKDGWSITHDPFYIKIDDIEFFIDLGAERILAAQKAGQKIAIEVKSFIGSSEVTEFHLALGQILNYRLALRKVAPERILYLAITAEGGRSRLRRETAEYLRLKIHMKIFSLVSLFKIQLKNIRLIL